MFGNRLFIVSPVFDSAFKVPPFLPIKILSLIHNLSKSEKFTVFLKKIFSVTFF